MDAQPITSWPSGIRRPLSSRAGDYPYLGWGYQWAAWSPRTRYGGTSVATTPSTLAPYAVVSGALAWTDPADSRGNLQMMPVDTQGEVRIAGSLDGSSLTGGLATLLAGVTYSVKTSASCPNWAGGDLAKWSLTTWVGATPTTTTSPAIQASGPLTWTFTIPETATGARLTLIAYGTDPVSVVRFSKPTIHGRADTGDALGYLSTVNAVPMRTAHFRVPDYYRKAGWPTKAAYLLKEPGEMSFIPSTPPGTVGAPLQVDARAIDTTADLRYLADYNYSQETGEWFPWANSGGVSVSWKAGNAELAPYYASADDNQAFSYQLGQGATQGLTKMHEEGEGAEAHLVPDQVITRGSLSFRPGAGTWLYTDDLDALALTSYTVILVLSLSNSYVGLGGIWSTAPISVENGYGPETDFDPALGNYRSFAVAGGTLRVQSLGMSDADVGLRNGPQLHKPTYLALQMDATANVVMHADSPDSILRQALSLSGVTGPLVGSAVLGGDTFEGLSMASFDLFEVGLYLRPMTPDEITQEIKLLGQIYG